MHRNGSAPAGCGLPAPLFFESAKGIGSTMGTYEKSGDHSDYPEEIQAIQKALGVKADGRFGTATEAAVKAWQRANGLEQNGAVGPDVLLGLGLVDLLNVENGDEGELVRRIQEAVGVEADGIYGDDTEDAVRSWQKKNKLKATGAADAKTLGAMKLLSPQTAPVKPPASVKPTSAPTVEAPVVNAAPVPAAGKQNLASWAYQLADIDPNEIAALDVDLVVIDYAADGSDDTAFRPTDVAQMTARPGGGKKLLISYMSIGEAEDYRYYWNAAWKKPKTRPAWLDDENPDWEGNYKVRYWDPDWQRVIMGSPNAYLDRILAAGFDGVYLDIIDAFEYWRDEKAERPDADKDMIEFVTAIADYARKRNPGFLVIPQNGEALLEDEGYRSVISAIGKEDVFYGQDGDGRPNKKDAVSNCLGNLDYAVKDDIPVLVIEYLDDGKKIADAKRKLDDFGCTATYFGPRDLASVRTA